MHLGGIPPGSERIRASPALFGLAVVNLGTATAQEVKQIRLTEKHIQGFIAADEEMAIVIAG